MENWYLRDKDKWFSPHVVCLIETSDHAGLSDKWSRREKGYSHSLDHFSFQREACTSSSLSFHSLTVLIVKAICIENTFLSLSRHPVNLYFTTDCGRPEEQSSCCFLVAERLVNYWLPIPTHRNRPHRPLPMISGRDNRQRNTFFFFARDGIKVWADSEGIKDALQKKKKSSPNRSIIISHSSSLSASQWREYTAISSLIYVRSSRFAERYRVPLASRAEKTR